MMFAVEKMMGETPVLWFQENDGSLWITAEEIGKNLGFKEGEERRSILKLAARNANQLAPFRSVVKLTTEAGVRETTIFEEHGAWILAMKARTAKAEEVQLHIASLMTRFQRKGVVVLDREEFEEHERQRNDLITLLQERASSSEEYARKCASAAGAALSYWRRHKPEKNPLQEKFPFIEVQRIGEVRDDG